MADDPVLKALDDAPVDDRPETTAEKAAIAAVNPKDAKPHQEVVRQLDDHAAE